ncbi:lipopolysaccharide biosynthesis protein [Holdemanella biformis]|uniref:lipopolysaccharide biosynthesis protein n=1 Tax=Holdemanella biformis TaxID=1735 RepID=UPI002E7883DA|nr:oligosaccharide flippase family protein [Holdemanella biformis]MEE0667488.1 oligosaccharide flippase family protein [Holdemanella biformis]
MNNVYAYLLNKKVSLKENTLWYTMGTMCSSATSFLLMIYVTRILGVDEAGVFSISYSVGQLMLSIGWFGTRQFQVSDINEEFKFSDYLSLKLFMTIIIMMVGCLIYSVFLHFNTYKMLVTFLYCLFLICDVFADLFSARFQQVDKLFLSGMSYIIRILGYNLVILFSLLCFKNLIVAIVLAMIYSALELTFFDLQLIKRISQIKIEFHMDKIIQLIKNCFPLFISSFLTTFIVNVPKNAIELNFDSSVQTYYNIIFMPSYIINLFCMFIFVPLYTSIANTWLNSTKDKFINTVVKLMIFDVLLSLVVFAGCYFLGIPLLELVYGVDLHSVKSSFLVLIVAGCFTSMNSILSYIFTVIRRQKFMIYIYVVAMVLAQVMVKTLTLNYGIFGASLDYLIGIASITVMFMLGLVLVLRKD